MRSIRIQFAMLLFLITAFATGGMAGAAYWWMQRSLYREFDESLQARADMLAGLVERHGSEIELEIPADAIQQFALQSNLAFFVLLDRDGSRITASANFEKFNPILKFDAKRRIRSIELPGDCDGRQLSMLVQPRLEGGEPAPLCAEAADQSDAA